MKRPSFWTGLCHLLLLNAAIHVSQSSQNTKANSQSSNVDHKEVKEGKRIFWLSCPNANTTEISWRKNGNLMSKLHQLENFYALSCVTKSAKGNYTCHSTSKAEELPLRNIVLKVLEMTSKEKKNHHPCGQPNEELVQEFLSVCPNINIRQRLPCCTRFGPRPKNVSLSIHFNKSYEVCKLYGSQDQPWTLNVNWMVPFYGHRAILGWQISVGEVSGLFSNRQQCVRINSKDRLLNWNFYNVIPGATFEITVQSLPSGYGYTNYERNWVTKTISIPSWKEMCKTTGYNCKWKICMPVQNVTVTRQNTEAPVVSWRTSKFYTSPHVFLVHYRGKNCSDSGKELVKNGTRVILNNLKVHKCHTYFVQVYPIFYNSADDGEEGTYIEEGTYSKEVLFSAKIPDNQRDFCHSFPESPCCHVVQNINFNQRDQNSVTVTWFGVGDANNSKIITAYLIHYESYPNHSCHRNFVRADIMSLMNNTYVMINDLNSTCQNYTFQIKPLFNSSWCNVCPACGQTSKDIKFQLKNMQLKGPTTDKIPVYNFLKTLIVVVGVSFCAAILFFALVYRKRSKDRQEKEEIKILKLNNTAIEVFIAHSSHCTVCKDIAVAVATYLNFTGRCNSFMDLYALPKEWASGTTQYYENEIKKREKVIILCTINEDEIRNQESPEAKDYICEMNLIRSEIRDNCTTTKFIPVYMDFSSHLDIPPFLRNTKSFSLPSQLKELLLYIIEQPLFKPSSLSPIVSLEEDNNLLKQKGILETKIRELKIKHHKNLKNKNSNFIIKV